VTALHTEITEPRGPRRGTIIAIPGLAESAATLAPTAHHWAQQGWQVVAVDPRGHGSSPRWTPELLNQHPGDVIVEELVDTVEALGLGTAEPLVYFGHSAGGSAAAAAAARTAGVRAVILEDPFWRLPVTPHQDRQVAEAAADNLRRLQAMTDEARQAEAAATFPRWPSDELPAWSQAKADMDATLVANGDVIPTRAWPTLLADLRASSVPVQIITGTIKIGITANHRAIARSLGAETTVLDGATHFIRRDERARFHQITERFLDSALSRTR